MGRERRQHDRDSDESSLKASASSSVLNVHHRRRGDSCCSVLAVKRTIGRDHWVIRVRFSKLFQPRQAAGQKGGVG